MPLKPTQILSQLSQKRQDFDQFDKSAMVALQHYRAALWDASQNTAGLLLEQLAEVGLHDRGAEPLEPWQDAPNWVMASGLQWQSREASMAWVRDRLSNVSTFAVDGSQIYPSKDLSIPVALVQIGWYENRHAIGQDYVKDIDLEVMTPSDLKVSSSAEPVDRRVNMRRFEMETQRLIQYLKERSGSRDCLAFLDGSLVATFAEAFDESTRQFYVKCIVRLLQATEQYRVPLVAYIDTTYARDLTIMLQRLYDLPDVAAIHDAPLFGKFMAWGDRTPLFRCRRSGILRDYPSALGSQIGFAYLKAHDGFPVRLEFPLWVYEAGQIEQIFDWVRSEIVVGGGYPYVIETADQTAVLQASDRQYFYRLLQDWAEDEHLNLRLSRKMVSKARRR
jgi:hypothetical protein